MSSGDDSLPFGSLFFSSFIVWGVFAIIMATAANAQTTTYTYTGNAYDEILIAAPAGICPITGSFTTANPLGPNFEFGDNVPYTSISISDCITTITSPNDMSITVSTNAQGQINAWDVGGSVDGSFPVTVVPSWCAEEGIPCSFTANLLTLETEAPCCDTGTDFAAYYVMYSEDYGFDQAPGVGTWTCSPSCTSSTSLSIVVPAQGENDLLDQTDYTATSDIDFQAQAPSAPSGTQINWDVDLEYVTSGGIAVTPNEYTFVTTSDGATNTYPLSFQSEGGQLTSNATATISGTLVNAPQVQSFITGTAIPNSEITSELTSLYQPGFTGYTPQLLCQIALQESAYRQFKTETLFGVSARWPIENFPTLTVVAGEYIGLMQVPTQMNTAFDWTQNAEAGDAVFQDKINEVLTYQDSQREKYPLLPRMTGRQIEDSALALYGGFADHLKGGKLHFYIPGTSVTGQSIWVLNPADDYTSGEGISAATYVAKIRSRAVPN
jgi:hypothetical protein